MNCATLSIAVLVMTATTQISLAGELPKKGSTTVTAYLTGTISNPLEGWEGETPPGHYVMMGIVRGESDGSAFDKSFMRCNGLDATVNGQYIDYGVCTETDKDGDKVFFTYTAEGSNYTGGTGKYKGITGGGTGGFELLYQDKTKWGVIVKYKRSWEIK